jgi:hypothetical protein
MGKRLFGIHSIGVFFAAITIISVSFPGLSLRWDRTGVEGRQGFQWASSAFAGEGSDQPELSLMQEEIDLGSLGSGAVRSGILSVKKTMADSVNWSLIPLEGWDETSQRDLKGVFDRDGDALRVQLTILNDGPERNGENGKSFYSAQFLFEAGGRRAAFTRRIEPGRHRQTVQLNTDAGAMSFCVLFKLLGVDAKPLLGLEPVQIDFGAAMQGEKVSRRIKVTNEGWKTLKWQAAAVGTMDAGELKSSAAGKYVSFHNDEIAGSGRYTAARHLKERLELPGGWAEDHGYPYAPSDGHALRYHFSGTGVAVYFWKGPTVGQLTAFVDERFIFQQEGLSEKKERFEWQVAEGLPGGAHVLTLVNSNGPVAIEGLRIDSSDLVRLRPGQIALFPDNGAVTRQTNYVNITVDTKPLPPGHYAGRVLFDSNGGQKEVELSLEVTADNRPRVLDVYRYTRGLDHFLTARPQAESASLQARGYARQGIAFRLFIPGTPGTTEFYRWYHPQKGSYFYGYELKVASRPMVGYVMEGTIGNVATSRLARTRELYRWYHSASDRYFYTIDPKGEGIQKKGYQYDGIAGYVRP